MSIKHGPYLQQAVLLLILMSRSVFHPSLGGSNSHMDWTPVFYIRMNLKSIPHYSLWIHECISHLWR